MRKKAITFVVAGILALSLVGPAIASEIPPTPNNNAENITPFAEETEWYVRIIDGKVQKRLWSITEGKWLTDWIDA